MARLGISNVCLHPEHTKASDNRLYEEQSGENDQNTLHRSSHDRFGSLPEEQQGCLGTMVLTHSGTETTTNGS